MKCLTIWQPWASLIMIGAKPIEWRSWYAPRSMHGQRIGIHAGTRKVAKIEVYQLITDCIHEGRQHLAGEPIDHPTGLDIPIALDFLSTLLTAPELAPLSCLLGTAVIGEPRLAADHGYPVDSDRLEEQNWGWPLSDVQPLAEPVWVKGRQGFWTLPDAADAARMFVEAA
ncbi:ASCH domain-containing protein [Sphingomonas profundi]|uniref:ASCH domain-containing protein n=1 Tax=Alterirhizorhabdus profundi TaxID=2681549 RepID=UPI0012E75743|nr:ASCH domain-containing protein [Sphingomonas profundi]